MSKEIHQKYKPNKNQILILMKNLIASKAAKDFALGQEAQVMAQQRCVELSATQKQSKTIKATMR